jgi:hypothetical protein
MLANHPTSRRGSCLLLGLALGITYLIAGCGDGGGGDQPAPFSEEQKKKNQALISGGYREQILAEAAKLKAEAKQKATAKKGP